MRIRKHLTKLICLAVFCHLGVLACSSGDSAEPQPIWKRAATDEDIRPDIVLVVSDDMRWDLMSARGHEFLDTPHMDILANEGAMMMNAFVPVAVCSQSRAAILTGKDVHKASAPVMVWKNNSFLETQKTIGSYLQEAGYTTAFLGKWHLGEGSKPKPGFDHWESFDWLGDFNDPVIHRNGEAVAHEGYVDDVLSSNAHRVLYENREPGKPMFLMVSLKAPHLQFEHPQRHAHAMESDVIPKPETYDEDYAQSGKPMGIFDWLSIENHPCGLKCFANSWQRFIKYHFRAVLGLDDQVGVLRKAIAEGGKPDNTLFIFTSDNGYSLGDHGLSAKHFVYEEPVRVPFLVDAPGDSDRGRRPEGLVSTIDIAPTLLDYANAPIPSDMSGRSLKPLLEGDSEGIAWREELFLSYEKERKTVPTQAAVRTERYKLIQSVVDATNYELYDLLTDPKETNNVYNDAAYTAIRDEMRRRLRALLAKKQWTPRATYGVNNVLVSSPVASSETLSLGSTLSMQPITVGQSGSTGLTWREVAVSANAATIPLSDPGADITASAAPQTVFVSLPFERLVSWDPFVQVLLNQQTNADIFADGELIYQTSNRRGPGDAINPPLIEQQQHVVIAVHDSGAMNLSVRLRVAEDTIRLPLENRVLGNSPGRFVAERGWQPHKAITLTSNSEALGVSIAGEEAAIQNDDLYLNEAVTIEIDAHTIRLLQVMSHVSRSILICRLRRYRCDSRRTHGRMSRYDALKR